MLFSLDLIKPGLYNLNMDTFTALADPTRRSIIEMLARRGELTATDISDRFNVSPPAISQHLKVLRKVKLLRMEKRAQKRIYSIDTVGLGEVEDWLTRMRSMWNERFDALEKLLEAEKDKSKQGKQSGPK